MFAHYPLFLFTVQGTPLQNNMLELFSLLHYIDPDEFSDPKSDGLFLPIESGRDLSMDEKIARIHEILKPRYFCSQSTPNKLLYSPDNLDDALSSCIFDLLEC